MTEKQIQIFS